MPESKDLASSSVSEPRILLVGYGNMGRAILNGWVEHNFSCRLCVVSPSFSDNEIRYFTQHNIENCQEASLIREPFDIIVFAVKPAIIKTASEQIKHLVKAQTLICSIAAGVKTSVFTETYGDDHPVLRMMPNTPCAIGKGVIGSFANRAVSSQQKDLAKWLFQPLGYFCWLEEEDLLDSITAISGSGPAYVFLFIEELEKAALSLGIPQNLAREIVLRTVSGAAELAAETRQSPAELRQRVTSPGGTTEAALAYLNRDGAPFGGLIGKAAEAALLRAKELS